MGCYEKKYKKILFTIFADTLIISWIYYFPLQHFFAQRKYQEYAKRQGVVAGDIKSMKVYKDYKQDGYYITVEYYSDPDHLYDYQYFLIQRIKGKTLVDSMYCHIYNMESYRLDDFTGTVYKPLPSDR